MDKQKQILEIAEVIAKYISSRDFEVKFITNPKSKAFPFSHTAGVAEDLYNAGYRKESETAEKFAERFKQRMKDKYQGTGLWWTEIVLIAIEICKEITEGK